MAHATVAVARRKSFKRRPFICGMAVSLGQGSVTNAFGLENGGRV